MADAAPKRLAVFSEAGGGRGRVSAISIKELTGEFETERFRKMRQDNVRTHICCLPMAATNDMPQFDKNWDQALLKRIVTIPFRYRFEVENPTITTKLLAEKDAIFSDMVRELHNYSKSGLLPIPECAKATHEELIFGPIMCEFVARYEKCENARLPRKDLREEYIEHIRGTEAEKEIIIRKNGKEDVNEKVANHLWALFDYMGFKSGNTKGRFYRAQLKAEFSDENTQPEIPNSETVNFRTAPTEGWRA